MRLAFMRSAIAKRGTLTHRLQHKYNQISVFFYLALHSARAPNIVTLHDFFSCFVDYDDMDIYRLSRTDQAVVLADGIALSMFASCLLALSVFINFATADNFAALCVWGVSLSIINCSRWAICAPTLRYALAKGSPEIFLKLSTAWSLLSSLLWAAVVPMLASTSGGPGPYIVFVGAGICAGAVVQGRAHAAAVLAFILPILMVLFFTFVSLGTTEGYLFAFDILFFCGVMSRSAVQSENHFIANCHLKHEATALAASLQVANESADEARKRLEQLVRYDPLTGLLNRRAFQATYEEAIQNLSDGDSVALILIDLDGFKAINDTFGHAAGDHVLVEVSRRLRKALGPDVAVSRLGGDEFAVVCAGAQALDGMMARTEALLPALSEPIEWAQRSVSVGASIGFARYPQDGTSTGTVQSNADAALYAAKRSGRGCVRAFGEALRAESEARRAYELDLHDALERNELEVWFQPQVNMAENRTFGFEALVRWNHSRFGWVPPPAILAAALASRQSDRLTRFVVDECCRFSLQLDRLGLDDAVVAFNVSPRELQHYALPNLIRSSLAANQVAPSRLMVEITEEAALHPDSIKDLNEIRDLGLKIAIDDFGVAYSSFGALGNVSFDLLKIDRSFIIDLGDNRQRLAPLKAILAAAGSLGVSVIAEGVETREQAMVLWGLGCRQMQGYHFGRPAAPQSILEGLANADGRCKLTGCSGATPASDEDGSERIGAGDGDRTHDPDLGKVVLYR